MSDHATNIAYAIYDPTVEKYVMNDSSLDIEDDNEETDKQFMERIEKMHKLSSDNIEDNIEKNIHSKIVASSVDLSKRAFIESKKIAENAKERIEHKQKTIKIK